MPVAWSQSTRNASRPFFADQKSVATTATPLGIWTTARTPGIFSASLASKDFTLAPKRGGCATTAVRSPGIFTSCVNFAVPFAFTLESFRETSLPM